MNDEIYIPNGALSLDDPRYNWQLRLGIQGFSGTSKTWAFTTFQNPVFISFDRGLISHIGRKDIVEVPFYEAKFVDSIVPRSSLKSPPNRKDALIKFLEVEGPKFSKNQLLIVDASTGVQTAYHAWWEENKNSFVSKGGEVDVRKEWRLKLAYFTEIMTLLKSFRCSVGYLCHESPDRTDSGALLPTVRPLLTGQFQDELMTHFTDWFRALAVPKPKAGDNESYNKFKAAFNIDDATAKEWIASGTKDTIYIWQTQSDNIAKCKTSLINAPKYLLADYKTFSKYQRKPETKEQ